VVFNRILIWLSDRGNRTRVALGLLVFALIIGFFSFTRAGQRVLIRAVTRASGDDPRNESFSLWWTGTEAERQRLITRLDQPCNGAPFLMPAEGYIGLLYGDPRGPYSEDHRHQGIDIFSPGDAGITPVYAAYDGYLTREIGWTSALIIRVPNDPLQPGRQIWLYYTHMASGDGSVDFIDAQFPQDSHEVPVRQGDLLGYTGNWSGNPLNPVGVHLHFSIVKDNGFGSYTNELYFDNTIDSSQYLGIPVNYACAPVAPTCATAPLCSDAILSAGGG
jgi:murein DD-endopeptidase MepM/ murein hydrolase activator NlpD